MSKTYDLTSGNTTKLILRFFFPMFFTNMLQQIYTIADTAIVGKGLGDNALGAVGNMSSLTFLIIGFSMGLANGFSVLIAQSYGAKDYKEMRRVTAAAIKLSLIMVVILTVLSVTLLEKTLILLQTSELLIKDGLTYGYIIFGGLITTIAYNMCACVLRAIGDSKTPLIAIIASTSINIVLDSLFIFVFKTGVEGAAFATIFAQVISAFICFMRLRKIDILHLTKEDFKVNIALDLKLLQNGVPMAFMNSITAVGCMVVQYFVNDLGPVYTTAYSACSKFINLFMQPACTAGFTMSSFTSQNYGARKYDRIKEGLRVCLGIALTAYLILGTIMFLFPKTLAGFMLNGEESIALAAEFLPLCGIMLFSVDFLFVFRSGVQGMGRPFVPMCSGILEMVLRISVIVFLISDYGFKATAYAEVTAWFGAMAVNAIAFAVLLRGRLKQRTDAEITIEAKA